MRAALLRGMFRVTLVTPAEMTRFTEVLPALWECHVSAGRTIEMAEEALRANEPRFGVSAVSPLPGS